MQSSFFSCDFSIEIPKTGFLLSPTSYALLDLLLLLSLLSLLLAENAADCVGAELLTPTLGLGGRLGAWSFFVMQVSESSSFEDSFVGYAACLTALLDLSLETCFNLKVSLLLLFNAVSIVRALPSDSLLPLLTIRSTKVSFCWCLVSFDGFLSGAGGPGLAFFFLISRALRLRLVKNGADAELSIFL